jgi:hypothetical protein
MAPTPANCRDGAWMDRGAGSENPHPALKRHPLLMLGKGTTMLKPSLQHWERGFGGEGYNRKMVNV